MTLSAALLIASSEIGNINGQLGLISHNIANANTPDYATEEVAQTSVDEGGIGMGAREGLATRDVNQQMQATLFGQNASVASLTTQQSALQQVDAAQGTVASGNDIPSLLGALQTQFSGLAGAPDNQAQQQATVQAAQALTSQINTVADTIGTQRQTAQNNIVSEVGQVNSTLATLGSLSDQIVQARLAGQSTADLENQRDAAEDQLSQLIGVRYLNQPNGDLLVTTASGLTLPIHGTTTALSTSAATIGASSYAGGGGVPAITLNGQDVTASLTGGQLGGNIQLRDTTLPTLQANLDEFSYQLASRFAAQGLTLFTDPAGNVPTGGGTPTQSGYVGFANTITVNPAVVANPSAVRDGNTTIAGSATGASAFTPNPAGGPSGFTTLITRVLNYALGSDAQAGVAQPTPATTGLGPAGTLGSGYAAPADLPDLASAMVADEASRSADVTNQLTSAQSLQQSLQSQLASGSSVSLDTQMSQMITLQNAYGANARVMSTVQAMWTQLQQIPSS